MPIKNVALTVTLYAYDTAANAGRTGDAGNITVRAVGDGAEYTPAAGAVEVDATNLKGTYTVALSAAEMNYNAVTVGGRSATAGVVVYPFSMTTDGGLYALLNKYTGIQYTGAVAAGTITAGGFTVTLDADSTLDAATAIADLSGLFCTVRTGPRKSVARPVSSVVINTTSSITLTFATPFGAAPVAGNLVSLSE